jgi:hypothetical protein
MKRVDEIVDGKVSRSLVGAVYSTYGAHSADAQSMLVIWKAATGKRSPNAMQRFRRYISRQLRYRRGPAHPCGMNTNVAVDWATTRDGFSLPLSGHEWATQRAPGQSHELTPSHCDLRDVGRVPREPVILAVG